MKISKVNATFFQNRFNYYIGNIIIDETLYIEDDYIIIGNIITPNNIVAKGNLIVIGDIKSKLLYAFKDIFCRGKMDIQIEEVEGTLNKIENINKSKEIKVSYDIDIIKTKHFEKLEEDEVLTIARSKINIEKGKVEDNLKKSECYSLNKNNTKETYTTSNANSEEKGIKNNLANKTRIKRIYDIHDIEIGDRVKHNTLGEGEILNINNSKIHIDFIKIGSRYISTSITLKLGLLKKYINDDTKPNLNTSNSIVKSKNIPIKKNIESVKESNEKLNDEELYLKKICKNKPITFYSKYINEYIIDVEGDNISRYICHYIKFKNITYIRFNHICDILDTSSGILEKFMADECIKVSYKDRCINGIKFITLEDCYRIATLYDIQSNRSNIFNNIISGIEKDSKENLENAIPYWSEIIENILIHKNMNIEELSKEWNINQIQIRAVVNGFTPQLTKLKQLIKENKIQCVSNDIHCIRKNLR
ncbi:hypothetical protein [Paraclostridium sordellii]|uniref:hypothetical protein n=1 Tax=Paraclostridium sordellii TaxID=1505 RepID=UPI0022E6F0BB|nr:hypothetical protein [Paeniclostridium sordellii]